MWDAEQAFISGRIGRKAVIQRRFELVPISMSPKENIEMIGPVTKYGDGSFIDAIDDPVVIFDDVGLVLRINSAALALFNSDPGQYSDFTSIQSLFDDISDHIPLPISKSNATSHAPNSDFKCAGLQMRLVQYYDSQNHFLILKYEFDSASSSFLKLVLDSIPARVFWKDKKGTFVGCNSKFACVAGMQCPNDLVGMTDYDIFPDQGHLYLKDDLEVMRTGTAKLNIEEPQTLSTGQEIWISTNKVPIRDSDGDVVGVMGSYNDITERVQHQKLMEYQARVDHLTKLPNRLALQEEIKNFESNREPVKGGVLFIDLDRFKLVNDSLGHDVGDNLLVQVSERIKQAVDGRGFLARLGGDEFSVLVAADSGLYKPENREYLNDIAYSILKAVIQPYAFQNHCIHLGVSIGISIFNGNCDAMSDVLKEADIAMYEAKSTGRNKVLCFDENMQKKIDYTHTLRIGLESAIENDEFDIVIQPLFDHEYNCLGGEALLRWNSPDLGSVPPCDFIPECEQSGLIYQVGLMVLEKMVKQLSLWCASYPDCRIKPIAVNVSTRQFQNSNFIDDIVEIVDRYQIDASLIELEITESLLMDNREDTLVKLREIERMGFATAIDDFGTGYSSLNYISKLPIGKLKIDQSFTQNIAESTRQLAVVETIIRMANTLGMKVTAEGVETEQQLEQLINLGCKEFQGYLYSKPISIAQYESDIISPKRC